METNKLYAAKIILNPTILQVQVNVEAVFVDLCVSKDKLRKQINLKQYVTEQIGLPTLKDILDELEARREEARAVSLNH